jgi:steroid delta-isomerase-like uncharacterized protein
MRSAREVILAWVDAFNRRDAEAAAALYHDDATNLQVAIGQPLVGRAAILEDLRAFFRAFPDSFTKVEGMLEDGEWVALEWSGGGTWRGVLGGQSATGRAFTLRGSGFFHVVEGKIKFQRGYWDRATWFGQLGLPIS